MLSSSDSASVPTLRQEDRLPLTGPHPAKFLKEIKIQTLEGESNRYNDEDERENRDAIEGEDNDDVNSEGGQEEDNFAAPNGFESEEESAEEAYYGGESATQRRNERIPAALSNILKYADGLRSFALSWQSISLPEVFQSVVSRALSSFRLQSLIIPCSKRPVYTFPSLMEFSAVFVKCPESFLRRHPNLRVLRFAHARALPNLLYFPGIASDFISIFGHSTQTIEHLVLRSQQSDAKELCQYSQELAISLLNHIVWRAITHLTGILCLLLLLLCQG
ncbi:hypothetical protein BT96DRAFT_1026489 [Gymnopus androsaceus JB14]|uniref:Uncharacterized protein n=1 Tax=Gymnopus androsaceus JB14 TaxID=1447944 RepID=A0A6A4GKF4_9AGAR|nr:hypothetical protein BT96DRAFT_1026489 [Gymnopus androsaceus JB14]